MKSKSLQKCEPHAKNVVKTSKMSILFHFAVFNNGISQFGMYDLKINNKILNQQWKNHKSTKCQKFSK